MKKARKRLPLTTFNKVYAALVDLGMDKRTAYATFMVLLGYTDAQIAFYGDTSKRSAKRWVCNALCVVGAESRSQLWLIGLALAEQYETGRCRATFARSPNQARRWLSQNQAAHQARGRA